MAEELANRLAWRYYSAMAGAALLAAVLGTVSAWFSGTSNGFLQLLAWMVAILGVVNLLGAVTLYRPVLQYLRGDDHDRSRWAARARALPVISGLWVFLLAAVAMLADRITAVPTSVPDLSSPRVLVAALAHGAVFASYLGLYAYLVAFDHLISLREALWRPGDQAFFSHSRFVTKLLCALLIVAAGPAAVAISDDIVHAAGHGAAAASNDSVREYFHQTLQMDVLGAVVLSAIVATIIGRGLLRPVVILRDAMVKVDAGDLSAGAPVVTDDEIGDLSDRFNRMVEGLRERERLRRTFSCFVPESVASALIADAGSIQPQEREATVLFTDIERFAEISSTLPPREVLAMLNDYFNRVAQIIHTKGGVITQFQGDAVLACFNLPVVDEHHARHALQAAVEIERQLSVASFVGGLRLRTRIGISTGPVVGGTVGGGERLGYTVHGTTVNIAARLEALNKEFGTSTLASARTVQLAGASVPVHSVGEVAIRGFTRPMELFTTQQEVNALPGGFDDAKHG